MLFCAFPGACQISRRARPGLAAIPGEAEAPQPGAERGRRAKGGRGGFGTSGLRPAAPGVLREGGCVLSAEIPAGHEVRAAVPAPALPRRPAASGKEGSAGRGHDQQPPGAGRGSLCINYRGVKELEVSFSSSWGTRQFKFGLEKPGICKIREARLQNRTTGGSFGCVNWRWCPGGGQRALGAAQPGTHTLQDPGAAPRSLPPTLGPHLLDGTSLRGGGRAPSAPLRDPSPNCATPSPERKTCHPKMRPLHPTPTPVMHR